MSQYEEIESIHLRLARLERHNRRFKVAVGALLLSFLGTAVIGQAVGNRPRSLEAQEFIVRDQEGHIRAKLSTSAYGTVLSFHQAVLPPGVTERKFMELGVLGDEQSANLVMQDPKSNAGIFVSVSSNVGGSVLVLKSAEEAKRLELVATRHWWTKAFHEQSEGNDSGYPGRRVNSAIS